MRTTLRLDDDVLVAVKERALRENRTAGAVLSDLARQALTCPADRGVADTANSFHGFAPLPHRGVTITNALIDRFREDEA